MCVFASTRLVTPLTPVMYTNVVVVSCSLVYYISYKRSFQIKMIDVLPTDNIKLNRRQCMLEYMDRSIGADKGAEVSCRLRYS